MSEKEKREMLLSDIDLTHLSPYDLNTFLKCPRKWLFMKQGRKGIAVDERKALFGKAIHNIILLYFSKVSDNPTDIEIEESVEKAFAEGSNFELKGFGAKTERIKKNFIDFEKKRRKTWNTFKPVFVEKTLEAKPFADLPPFRGILDFYGDETVIDWKTSGAEMDEDNIRQGKIYEIILTSNGYPVKREIFYCLDTGQALTVPKVTNGWIYKIALQMVEMVKANRFPPKPSGLCEYCEYLLLCEFKNQCLWLDV